MERLTRLLEGEYALAEGCGMERAVKRLALYENMHEELEKLRAEKRQTGGRFKELVARRLMNKSILDQFVEKESE